MNVRKFVDYSDMFTALDKLMTKVLPQMELYREIGKLVSSRTEKGAAVAAAEYLGKTYPDISGFSPRNLRRMRDFYRGYRDIPEIMAEAMTIGWTQNVVILEAELTLQEQIWYIQAARRFSWSKSTLIRMIEERTHEKTALDTTVDPCYSSSTGGDEDGAKEASRTFLQGLRDAEVQRELQRQGPPRRGEIRSVPFPPPAKTTLRSFAPPLPTRPAVQPLAALPPHGCGVPLAGAALGSCGDPLVSPPDRKRNNVAEKSNPRSPARGEILGRYDLCGEISSFGTVHPSPGMKHRRRRCLGACRC